MVRDYQRQQQRRLSQPGAPCATINAALNKPDFVAGDTIRVAAGTYTGAGEQVVLLDKSATLSGGWNPGLHRAERHVYD